MHEGKLTLPVIHTARKNPEAHELAMKVRAMEASAEEIQRLVQLTIEEGGINYAEAVMLDFSQMASGLLDEVGEKGIAKTMQYYLDFVAKRAI